MISRASFLMHEEFPREAGTDAHQFRFSRIDYISGSYYPFAQEISLHTSINSTSTKVSLFPKYLVVAVSAWYVTNGFCHAIKGILSVPLTLVDTHCRNEDTSRTKNIKLHADLRIGGLAMCKDTH